MTAVDDIPDATADRNLYLAIVNPIFEALQGQRGTPALGSDEMDFDVAPGILTYATREHVQEIVRLAADAAHDGVLAYLEAKGDSIKDLCLAVGPGGKVCIRSANHSEQRHRFGVRPDSAVQETVVTFSPIHTDNIWEKPGGSVTIRAGEMIRVKGQAKPVQFKCHQWNADNGKEWLVCFADRGGERNFHPDLFISKARVVEARPAKGKKKR